MQIAFHKEHVVLLDVLGVMIQLRRMTFKKRGVVRFAYVVLIGTPEWSDHLEDLSVDVR
jgi:hypothetical protein